MSILALTKNYADSTLLFASDFTGMWAELEAKTNGNIDDDNLLNGWTSWASVTLSHDNHHYIGVTDTSTLYYISATTQFLFGYIATVYDTLFKIHGTTVMTLDSSGNLVGQKDLYFGDDTSISLTSLISYTKPVLVYVDDISIDIEQNTKTTNTTTIMFPSGPVTVTENTSSSSKFRRLKLSEYANGYATTHAGASNSGFRLGLSLISNTWYFVYAVKVRGGSDATASKFILVADSTEPTPANYSVLSGYYGANNWVYVGLFRYGFGLDKSTTLIPFVQDKSGWHMFADSGDTDYFFGIRTVGKSVTSSTYATVQAYGVHTRGNAAPITCSQMAVAYSIKAVGAEVLGTIQVYDSTGTDKLMQLPSFGANLDIDELHGFNFRLPNIGCIIKMRTG